MSEEVSVSLGEHYANFVEDQLGRGRYRDASAVMRAGLKLLEEQEATLASLRAALIEGEQSGISTRDVRDVWAAVKEKRTTNG